MQIDPIRDGTNWYIYCDNDPVNRVDKNGYWDVLLRYYVEDMGGSVTPHKHWYGFGLKSITVTLNGVTKEYTKKDYWINGEDRAVIDSTRIRDDFFSQNHGNGWDKHPSRQQVINYIGYVAITKGIPVRLALAVAWHESGMKQYNDNGTINENNGDYGIMQINKKAHPNAFRGDIISNWQANVNYGLTYLASCYVEAKSYGYGGDDLIKATYSNYNSGSCSAYKNPNHDAYHHVRDFWPKYQNRSWQ